MFRLSDEHIRAEYEAYTQMYLEDATPASVRGMAEMTLIKLGELVDKPQARRIKMVEKAFEEQRAAVERRKREAEQGEKAAKERARQDTMSAKAHEACVRVWRAVHSNPNVHLAGAEAQALAKRLHNPNPSPSPNLNPNPDPNLNPNPDPNPKPL